MINRIPFALVDLVGEDLQHDIKEFEVYEALVLDRLIEEPRSPMTER